MRKPILRLMAIVLVIIVGSAMMSVYSRPAAASSSHKMSKTSHKSKKNIPKSTSPGNVWERIRMGIRIPKPKPLPEGFGQIQPITNHNITGALANTSKTTVNKMGLEDDLAKQFVQPSSDRQRPVEDKSKVIEKFRIRHIISPKKSAQVALEPKPEERYTKLGRTLFAPKELSKSGPEKTANADAASGVVSSAKDEGTSKSPTLERIRTRLGQHPELFKKIDSKVAQKNGQKTGADKISKPNAATNTQDGVIRGCGDLNKKDIISLAQQGVLTASYNQMAEQCRVNKNASYARVAQHIAGYSQNKGFLYQISERARPYLFHIVDTLNKYNMPLDLALLPIVESAYKATALSPKDAAGIWQFIPSTGREYGLEQNESYDARLDVTASTHAAVRFLSGLNAHFKGDWLLTLAAYNSGQGTVDAAISRNQSEGRETDFWSLDLPAETQDYVPRLLALSSIFSNPSSYGIKLSPVKNEPYFIKITIDRHIDINNLVQKDLNTVAKYANFDHDEFSLLNAAYLKPVLTERRPFSFLMPISKANQLHQSLAYLAQADRHVEKSLPYPHAWALSSQSVKSGPLAPLVAINLPEQNWRWFSAAEQKEMASNKPTANDEKLSKSTTTDDYWVVHYLDKGESLKTIAEYNGINEEELREINKIKRKQTVALGQRLLLPIRQVSISATNSVKKSILYQSAATEINPFNFRF